MGEKFSTKEFFAAMRMWEHIAHKEGYEYPMSAVAMEHSGLLRRLLSGKPPLDEPPPRSFSRPWYDLIEGEGPWDNVAVHGGNGDIYVNQHPWHVCEVLTNGWVGSPTYTRKREVKTRSERYRLTRVRDGHFGYLVERLP